jgi:DHA1 family tetracycline resistance protein-like MFS transporter
LRPNPGAEALPGSSGGKRRPALAFIFLTVVLEVLGFGLLIPVAPSLVQGLLSFDAAVPTAERAAQATWWFGLLMSTYYAMMFLFAPFMGALSDVVGRRPVILISLLGSGVDYFVQAFAPTLWVLFLARAFNGFTGASFSVCQAYVADVTEPSKRAGAYGLIGAAFGIGFVLGPLLGGYVGDPTNHIPLIGPGDVHYPFIAAGILTIINWVYGLVVLPESLPKEGRAKRIDWRKANPIGMLPKLATYPLVLNLAIALFLLNLAMFGLHSTWAKYTETRYGWDPQAIGLSLFAVGLGAAVVQGGLTRRLVPRLGEGPSLLYGIGVGVLAYVGYGLATHGWMIYAVVLVASLGGIAQPAGQSMITQTVGPREQGAVQGALTSLQSLAGIIGPLIATNAFHALNGPDARTIAGLSLPGGHFLLCAALAGAGLVLTWRAVTRHWPGPGGSDRDANLSS